MTSTMALLDKIASAFEYVHNLQGTMDAEELRNDAANIFADSYEEYLAIWMALKTSSEEKL